MSNPWKILGVHRMSTDEEIASAYKTLAQSHHPDRGGRAANFAKINEAYKAIKDKRARRVFIESLYMEDRCYACQGRGVHWKSKGLTEKIYTACSVCDGSGFSTLTDDDDNLTEETDDVIEL